MLDLIIIGIAIMNLLLLALKPLSGCIKIVSGQGILIGLLPLLFYNEEIALKTALVSSITILLKGIIFPSFFLRALKIIKIKKDIEPYIGYKLSVLIGLLALVISFWISRNLTITKESFSSLVLPASFFTIFTGLFMIVSRVKAITQALGYLVLENGIYMFSYAFLIEQPFLVEMGILLDVFVAIFIMGITIFHIKRQFDHIDTSYMSQLKD